MPTVLAALCYLLAFLCFVVAALGRPTGRFNLIAAGLAFWVLVPLVNAVDALD